MILLDTHVLLWLRSGDNKLGSKARRAIEAAHGQGEVGVCAISFWEVAMLQAAGRLRLLAEPNQWRRRIMDDGVVEVPVCGEAGIRATQLLPAHADPADRIIVACAALNEATLCTADGVMLDRPLPVATLDATG